MKNATKETLFVILNAQKIKGSKKFHIQKLIPFLCTASPLLSQILMFGATCVSMDTLEKTSVTSFAFTGRNLCIYVVCKSSEK